MKVGIITFHWGGSHGGVLQAYATSKYLINHGIDAFIIDYYPSCKEISFGSLLKPNRPAIMLERFFDYNKRIKVNQFREYLPLSKRYYSHEELVSNPPVADVYITGSDQVWNPFYLMNGENGITPVYYLDFCPSETKKVAMSVSFGCNEYAEDVIVEAKKHIIDFFAVSVREDSGLKILKSMDFDKGEITSDPTGLLEIEDYLNICNGIPQRNTGVVSYILHNNKNAKKLIKYVKKILNVKQTTCINNCTIQTWLAGIRDCTCVVTNSFHCVMFCLYFHKQFYVVLENGELSGMNNRINTVLNYFDLQSCIITCEEEIRPPVNIDWKKIDTKMKAYRSSLANFLLKNVIGNE